ncbi:ribosomal protein S5-alanine N-acetyltransferase [Vibrio mangrovi]|uniref:Putative ribosomal N-acetyltransferase YdaF n=1 Tax=Vibrio mangrovi TaxID=474394 RepID=A0A1Y6IN75_9VIBR|nr:ribosomal protein S5-alanine N-acetyltransferase [Vibrio mangrovi]MDW6004105.1 ribosomal protein S5-alanine N-acetyltransferase [Vibrio mangrovi]SMR99097.1 Putative ribosomal N-acetyltransferase YdaF [Vibrio mangrovi]
MNGQVYDIDGDIVIRSARLDDARMIARYFSDNRKHLKPWEPKREEEFFVEAGWAQRLIKLRELQSMALGYYLLILDMSANEMVGTISFSQISRFPLHSCYVGYSLAEKAQGKGIMTRALKMACRYMFEAQNMHRISATYMPRNVRSEDVLNRLGFQYEGKMKDYLLINEQWEDHHMTSLINPDWQARTAS